MLPHSGMLPSQVIVASFKCSPIHSFCRASALQGATASTPPSDRLRGRRLRSGLSLSGLRSHHDSARARSSACRECIAPNTMVCAISLRPC
jgi:hypothetical protein